MSGGAGIVRTQSERRGRLTDGIITTNRTIDYNVIPYQSKKKVSSTGMHSPDYLGFSLAKRCSSQKSCYQTLLYTTALPSHGGEDVSRRGGQCNTKT